MHPHIARMITLDEFSSAYADLEQRIRSLMIEHFSETCSLCTACCCRADICEEAIESAFLSDLLKRQGVDLNMIDERFGWLDLSGCSLEYGRPPVCYSYFCDELLARLPDDDARLITTVMGKLLHHIGLNAVGGWHLTEIMEKADFEKLDMEQLHHRLEASVCAFQVIEEYIDSGRISISGREVLSAITTEDP